MENGANPAYLTLPRGKTLRRRMFLAFAVIWSCHLLFPAIRNYSCEFLSLLHISHPQLCQDTARQLVTALEDDWNLFYHLGGNGPWIPRRPDADIGSDKLPSGCAVDQVHMLSRHAERYPTKNAGQRHLNLLERLKSPEMHLSGSLSFISQWIYFTDPSKPDFEDLTTTGPYAGTLQAVAAGKKLRLRYGHLLDAAMPTNFWTCSSPRDIETAKYFADGFFGHSWSEDGSAKLHIIPEMADRGADTLTPGDTCLAYIQDEELGHDYGYHQLAKWQATMALPIAARLETEAPGMDFSALDIYSMMEICGFEILVRGSSPWCEIFSRKEWEEFEYARDLLHFYRAGPGNKYAGAMGWLWLNATQDLISNEARKGVYFSFVHDGDIIPLIASLGLLDEPERNALPTQHLPTGHIKLDRRWRTSDVVPMGGRLVFERVRCQYATRASADDQFVRLFINDGLVWTGKDGEDKLIENSWSLAQFQQVVDRRGEKFGDFRAVCGLSNDAPGRITFLHQ